MAAKRTRREFIQITGATSAVMGLNIPTSVKGVINPEDGWDQGDVAHIIPTVSERRFLIKTSFKTARPDNVSLRINSQTLAGKKSDTYGFFWQFDVANLSPDTCYELQLLAGPNMPLCDPWPLKTFPAPNTPTQRVRILTYTCGGGDESLIQSDGVAIFNSIEARQQLLKRGLSFCPDIVIANGDQIYYDERTMLKNKPPLVIEAWQDLFDRLGTMDRNLPVFGTPNEQILKCVGDRQIAALYGTSLRSTPTFMLTDDHDLFENDEATSEEITLPPDNHMMDAARATQHLYYPEFLPDPNRPVNLPGSSASDRGDGLSEVFGTVRYGKLFEGLLYDTKRYVSIDGADGHMVPLVVEAWLTDRTRSGDSLHLAHIPSTPIGWSAGKWGEWYPDILGKDNRLGTDAPKPFWPSGWWDQHQRILKALGAQTQRTPVIMSGDLHMFSAAKISKSGTLNFTENPVHTIVVGPLGTGTPAFPSAARGVLPQPPTMMTMDEYVPPLEKNGFTIIDITEAEITVEFYAWRPPEPIDLIQNLEPDRKFKIARRTT